MSDAINFGRDTGAEKLTLEISVSSSKNKNLLGKAVECYSFLKNLVDKKSSAVTKLKVSGKQNTDSSIEVLDLIHQRMFLEFDNLIVGKDLRFSRKDRWNALFSANQVWKNKGVFKK